MKRHSFPACLFAVAFAAALALSAGPAKAQPGTQPDGEAEAACLRAPARACVLDLARRLAMGVEQKAYRAKYLSEVAEAQADAGLMAEAETAAREAQEAIKELARSYDSDNAIIGLAAAWAKLGKFDEALQLAGKPDTYVAYRAQISAAGAMGRAGRLGRGLQLAQAIDDKRTRDLAVREVAWDLRYIALERGQEGMLIDALRAVESEEKRLSFYTGIHHPSELIPALQIMAEAMALRGRNDEAWQLSLSSRNPGERVGALIRTGGIWVKAGGVAPFLQNVQQLDEQPRGRALRSILRSSFSHDSAEPFRHETEAPPEPAKVQEPDLPGALRIAQSFPDAKDQDFALGIVAVAQAREGGFAQAQATVQSIADGKARYFALRTVGRAQALAGLDAESAASFRVAVEIARTFEAKPRSSEMRDAYLSDIAIAQANAGHIADARRTVDAIEGNQSSMSIGVDNEMHNADYERRWPLYYIARAEAKAGNIAEAIRLARSLNLPGEQLALGEGVAAEGLAEGRRIGMLLAYAGPERWKAEALATAAEKCAIARRFADALRVAAIIGDLNQKARVLAVTGQLQARAGQKAEAAAAFAGAVQAALSIKYDWRVSTLVFVARKMPE